MTLRAILRLLPNGGRQTQGEISLNGDRLDNADDVYFETIRGRQISMIFQEPGTSLNPVYRTGDQVMEAIRLHQDVSKDEARNRTIELYREVGIPEPERRIASYPHEMSGGQKQRSTLARALIRQPQILILDDALSAVDTHTEEAILGHLREIMRNRTTLIIAHRISTLRNADHIIVLDEGRIAEQGTHDALVSNGNFYAELYERQQLNDELESL